MANLKIEKWNRLIALVKIELSNLMVYASENERRSINVNYLYPTASNYCIYGQMTGSCFSERALELVKKCAIPVSETIEYRKAELDHLNSPEKFGEDAEGRDYFSALEVYIVTEHGRERKKEIVDFLKGYRQDLDFLIQ